MNQILTDVNNHILTGVNRYSQVWTLKVLSLQLCEQILTGVNRYSQV